MAHPDVFNVFLQILDDGRLTDSKGRTIDFKNTIIIMTSNLASEFIADDSLNEEEKEVRIREALRMAFKPEFLNRLDDNVIFHSLKQEQIREIVDIQLQLVIERALKKGIKLQIENDVKDYLAQAGFDPIYGARPLKRAIQEYLLNPLSEKLLEGNYQEGDSCKVVMQNGQVALG